MTAHVNLYHPSPLANLTIFFSSFPVELQSQLELLTTDPEALVSLNRANAGEIKKVAIVYSSENSKLNARYLIETNTIELSLKFKDVNVLPYIIFEVHNAGQKENFRDILNQAHCICKDDFVERFEILEFSSAKKTRDTMIKWLEEGQCLENPFFYLHANFRDHYLFQQIKGHSQSIAQRFERRFPINSSPYRGTWPRPPLPAEKKILKLILQSKAVLQNDFNPVNKSGAQELLDAIFQKINNLQVDHDSNEDIPLPPQTYPKGLN